MSQYSSVLFKAAAGLLTVATLSGCQTVASGAGTSSSSVVSANADRLVLGERVKGELTTRSALNVKDGSRYALYRFSLAPESMVAIEMDGSFEGVLSLYDEENSLLMVDSTLRIRSDEGGDYVVVVSGDTSDSYGPFTLSSNRIELNDTGLLVVPGTTRGWLQSVPRTYTFTVEEKAPYQIKVLSSDFDSVMAIEGPNGYYSENDDGDEEGNASIGDMLEPGEYTLTVGSYEGRQGLFDIDIGVLDVVITDTDTLVPGADITGWMGGDTQTYSLTIEEEGRYQIDMRSASLDSMLVIEGPEDFYVEDDDGGQHYNSRIVETLKPGTYQVNAHQHPEGPSISGVYSLSVQRR